MSDNEFEDDLAIPTDRKRTLTIAAISLVALLVIGGIPKILGFGWFAARMFTSQEIFVYVVNTSGQDLTIELPFAQPQTVRAGTVEILDTLSGPITIRALDNDGSVVEEIDVRATGDVLYNAQGSQCMAVVDVTPYYGGDQDEGALELVARIPEGTRIYQLEDAGAVMLPRHLPPDNAVPPVHWIETFSCNLLEEDQESMLLFNAHVRLQTRWEEYQERLEEYRESQGQ